MQAEGMVGISWHRGTTLHHTQTACVLFHLLFLLWQNISKAPKPPPVSRNVVMFQNQWRNWFKQHCKTVVLISRKCEADVLCPHCPPGFASHFTNIFSTQEKNIISAFREYIFLRVSAILTGPVVFPVKLVSTFKVLLPSIGFCSEAKMNVLEDTQGFVAGVCG